MEHLNRFLDEVLEHLSNRTTSRERASFHLCEAYAAEAVAESCVEYKMQKPLPERDAATGGRLVPPSEHTVLVGWCKSNEAHFAWILSSGLYNFRAGDRSGSIRLEPRIAGARHLLLHTKGGTAYPGLWRIKNHGPRLFSAEDLLKTGYPPALVPKSDAIYAVFDVEQDKNYLGWEWDFKNLKGKQEEAQGAAPFAVSLSDVLAIHRV